MNLVPPPSSLVQCTDQCEPCFTLYLPTHQQGILQTARDGPLPHPCPCTACINLECTQRTARSEYTMSTACHVVCTLGTTSVLKCKQNGLHFVQSPLCGLDIRDMIVIPNCVVLGGSECKVSSKLARSIGYFHI